MRLAPIFRNYQKAIRYPKLAMILLGSMAFALGSTPISYAEKDSRLSNVQPPEKNKKTLQTVDYRMKVVPEAAEPHIEISMSFPVAEAEENIKVQMPTWSPGDYHLQDHGKFVQEFHAYSIRPEEEKTELVTKHATSHTWEIETNGAERVEVTYFIPNTTPGFFSQNVKIEGDQAFINGPSAFMFLETHKDWKATLEVLAAKDWQIESSMENGKSANGAKANTLFLAPDYDTLADSPIVMGAKTKLKVLSYEANGVNHRVVFFGKIENVPNPEAFPPVLKRITETENAIMQNTPYSKYLFLFDVDGEGGGLEHLNSCRIALFSKATPKQFGSFFSHEFFHLWNVKRIRPSVLGPFDYVKPPKTRNLWFAEGVTEYYAHVATYRAGVNSEQEFLSHWKTQIARMGFNKASKKITADEASLRVWESGNSQGYGGLSYYDKGELIGLCLDLKIRHLTGGKKSLDDVMRLLMERHNPPNPGYGEDELKEVVSKIAGANLDNFYTLIVRTAEPMPFAECMGFAGLKIDGSSVETPTPQQLEIRKGWLNR